MKKATILATSVVAVTLSYGGIAGAAPVVVLGPKVDSSTGITYEIIGDKVSGTTSGADWSTIESDAEALGGHLATIHNATENQWITDNLVKQFNSGTLPLWIGLYDPTHNDGGGDQHAADFVWIDGSASTYRNWNTGEPNNYLNQQEYYTAINYYYSYFGFPYPQDTWTDTALNGSIDGVGVRSSGPYYGIVALPVPEPMSLGVLAAGCVFGLARRKR